MAMEPSTAPQARKTEAQSTPTPRAGAGRRRDKPQLSCDLCRRRKLRCDRLQPCSTCSSRGHKCTYPEDSRPPAASASIHQRLVQLERLVMSSVRKVNFSPDMNPINPHPSLASPRTESPSLNHYNHGVIHTSDSELQYVGDDHWSAILESIADLKDHCRRQPQMRTPPSSDSPQSGVEVTAGRHSLLLYGGCAKISQKEILAALPPKGTVDRYISRYFNRSDLVSAAVHGPTFLRQYETFWGNPSDLPIAWVGLLFGMMCLAVLASEAVEFTAENGADQQAAQISLYREKIVQSLMLSEYTQSGPHVLEAMIHYVYIEFALHADADKDIWFLLAIEVNLAKRMGCHRDPNNFPGLKPLESEMRRRLWSIVMLGDILISSQMGMPRMISDWQCDTAEPRNLNDTDLDQDMLELPPSRPETEMTTVLGTIARRRLLVALGTISDIAASVKPCDYSEVMRAEAKLHEAAASIPPPLRRSPTIASLTDPPEVFMSQLFISHLFYKGQIMLHRRFVMAPTSANDASFSYSCKACIEACVSMLDIQHVLDEETRRGGRLDRMRWRVSSILNHQFLTATMILCSLLHRRHCDQREAEIMRALRRTREIWLRNTVSEAAGKAADAIDFVLSKRAGDEGHPDVNQTGELDAQFTFDFSTLESGTVPNEWLMLTSNGAMW
ncbi:uncharacterized protein EI97DRAFT_451767 [Westerdykella ornata]|uniref:Zn(2)-C6 fungal-type domain-containing protein n=1 Tax=Westerdykella ornata TaxID=318751 RepID=A0A6A6JDD6_WESOR|nr:uncharacterized protein EI97DRAFT_451767 [Westerdykella ornata]KAF2274183.1 hypothetical protein EI97DRAFT_451767 [Westerdykella ornata]